MLFSPYLLRMFSDAPEVVAYGVTQARIMGWFYFLAAITHSVGGILRGAGKAMIPMLATLSCWCLFRVAYISVIVRLWDDIQALLTAYPVTWMLSAVVLLTYYFKADWIHTFDRLEKDRASAAEDK